MGGACESSNENETNNNKQNFAQYSLLNENTLLKQKVHELEMTNNQYMIQINQLLFENRQLKLNLSNSMIFWNQMIIPQNNFNNMIFNQPFQSCINTNISTYCIIFKFINELVVMNVSPNDRLLNIFYLMRQRLKSEENKYCDIKDFTFYYSAKPISHHFLNNDEVRAQNPLSTPFTIDVIQKRLV